MEKLEAWSQAKREAANLSIEELDELLKIDEGDGVSMLHADEEQQKEKDYLITEVKVSDLSSCDKADLIVMINALKIQITCMNDDLDDKDEIIEELEHNKKKDWANNVSKLMSQEIDVLIKDVTNVLQHKIDDLTQENNGIFAELLKCSRRLRILQHAERKKLIAKHQACWLCGNNRHLHPVSQVDT